MRVIDNDPLDRPIIGKMIEEGCGVGQLVDNCIYLIADPKSEMAKKALEYMEEFKRRSPEGTYYNHYELEVVQEVELKNHPLLRERVEQHGDNFLMQLASYNSEGKKRFVIARTEECKLIENISLMTYVAERVTKFDMRDLLRSFVDENPEEFAKLAKIFVRTRRFEANYCAVLSEQSKPLGFGMASSTSSLKKQMEVEGVVTHQQRMELYDRLFDNLKKSHRKHDPKVEAEIEFIIKCIDPATLRMFFQKQSPKLQEKITNFVNPKRLAEVSTMDLEIRWSKEIDKIYRTNGHYRLYLCRGDESLQVHFRRSAGFVLYLIYLMDRKKNGEKVDTLNIAQYKSLFGKLYKMTYGMEGETVFTDMLKNYNAQNDALQKGLHNVLQCIRDNVGITCERMQEPAEPFLLQDATAHLAVLPEHIIIPDEIMALI